MDVIANRGPKDGSDFAAILLKLAAAIRPDLDPQAPEAQSLLADVSVFAATRALLEERAR